MWNYLTKLYKSKIKKLRNIQSSSNSSNSSSNSNLIYSSQQRYVEINNNK